jgi:hypothetical protein
MENITATVSAVQKGVPDSQIGLYTLIIFGVIFLCIIFAGLIAGEGDPFGP